MYLPPHFAEHRPEEIRRIIEQHPLGTLVTTGPSGLDAHLLPFDLAQLDGQQGVLRAHAALANPLVTQVPQGSEVLVVFRANDAYVSPNWYPSKAETHRLVPTWNYQVVNVHGRIRFTDDEKFLLAILGRLTRTHEGRTQGERAWRMSDAPPGHVDALLKSIVGIEIEFTRVEAKSKLSQNREERDRLGAASGLEREGHDEVARAMREVPPQK